MLYKNRSSSKSCLKLPPRNMVNIVFSAFRDCEFCDRYSSKFIFKVFNSYFKEYLFVALQSYVCFPLVTIFAKRFSRRYSVGFWKRLCKVFCSFFENVSVLFPNLKKHSQKWIYLKTATKYNHKEPYREYLLISFWRHSPAFLSLDAEGFPWDID